MNSANSCEPDSVGAATVAVIAAQVPEAIEVAIAVATEVPEAMASVVRVVPTPDRKAHPIAGLESASVKPWSRSAVPHLRGGGAGTCRFSPNRMKLVDGHSGKAVWWMLVG